MAIKISKIWKSYPYIIKNKIGRSRAKTIVPNEVAEKVLGWEIITTPFDFLLDPIPGLNDDQH